MARGRREKIDERMARMVREDRARGITDFNDGSGGGILQAYMAYEDWFSGDGPGEFPIPATDHQPAFDEPFMNSFGAGVWDAGDPYWLRVPADGIYRVSLNTSPNVSLDLGGPGGYHGIQLDTYVEMWRSLPPGSDPEGRDDPFGPGAWGGVSVLSEQKFLPEGHDSFNLGYTLAAPPFEMTEDDSLRVIYRANTVDPFGGGDEFFYLAYQGLISLEML